MGHGFESYGVLGIVREMPYSEDSLTDMPRLPNGRTLEKFGFRSPGGSLKLESSSDLMEDPGKFLIGYLLGSIDHHGAVELPEANDPNTRKRLIEELRNTGLNVDDSEVRLYIHMDSDQFEH